LQGLKKSQPSGYFCSTHNVRTKATSNSLRKNKPIDNQPKKNAPQNHLYPIYKN
jgi:hypothetical protein